METSGAGLVDAGAAHGHLPGLWGPTGIEAAPELPGPFAHQ